MDVTLCLHQGSESLYYLPYDMADDDDSLNCVLIRVPKMMQLVASLTHLQ